MTNTTTPIEKIEWIEFVNGAGEEIPPFALVRPTSVSTDGVFTVGKPNADANTDLYVNGPTAVPASGHGVCSRDFPLHVAYNTGDGTPANGEEWGSRNNDWKLRKTKTDGTTANTGITILGGATAGRVMVTLCACQTTPVCPPCDVMPIKYSLEVSGITQVDPNCDNCVNLNGTFTLNFTDEFLGIGICLWKSEEAFEDGVCGNDPNVPVWLIQHDTGATFSFIQTGDSSGIFATYTLDFEDIDCLGPNTFTLTTSTNDKCTNWPASLTIVPI